MGQFAKRRSVGSGDPCGCLDPSSVVGAVQFPDLAEFLLLGSFEDNSVRETGSVTLFCQDGRLKASFADKANGLVGYVTLDGFSGLLERLQAHLEEGTIDWRRSKEGYVRRK